MTDVTIFNGINIGSGALDPSAAFEVDSTNQGTLPPRMTTAQRDAIANPASYLTVFNISTARYEVNQGTPAVPNWQPIGNAPGVDVQIFTRSRSESDSNVGAKMF